MSEGAISIFISYSRANSVFVDRLEAELKVLGFDTWVDRRKIEAGQIWLDVLEDAINRCDVMLVVLSPDSEKSDYVKMEYRRALRIKKKVIPLEYQPCSNIPIDLDDMQRVDFKDNFAQGLGNLLIVIRRLQPDGDERYQPEPDITTIQTTPDAPSTTVDGQKPQDPSKPNLDEIYQKGVVASVHGDLELAAALWQQVLKDDPHFRNDTLEPQLEKLLKTLRPERIQRMLNQATEARRERKWREAAGSWQALLGLDVEEDMDKLAKDNLEFCLRAQGNEANKIGDWSQAIGSWQALLDLKTDDLQAKRQLGLAKHNQKYVEYYKDTQKYIDREDFPVAKSNLKQLWEEFAPYYGDPEGFAAILGILETIRTPATFDSEDEARLEWKRQEEKAKQAQEQRKIQAQIEKQMKEKELRLIEEQKQLEIEQQRKRQEMAQREQEAKERKEREKLQREELARRQELDRQQQAQAAAERAVRELALRRSPAWFIENELGGSNMSAFYSLFALLGGIGIIVAFITKSLSWTLGIVVATAIIIYLSGFYRVIQPQPKWLQRSAKEGEPASTEVAVPNTSLVIVYLIIFLLAVVFAYALAFISIKFASPLNYNQQHTGTILWLFQRNWLLSRQLALGLILGVVAGGIAYLISAVVNDSEGEGMVIAKGTIWGVIIGICSWLVVSLIAWLFNWGWGFGYGWEWSSMAFIIGIISMIALISTIIICAKGLTSR